MYPMYMITQVLLLCNKLCQTAFPALHRHVMMKKTGEQYDGGCHRNIASSKAQ